MTNKPEERPITPNKSKGLVHAMVNRNGEIHEKCPDCRGECCKVVGVPPTQRQSLYANAGHDLKLILVHERAYRKAIDNKCSPRWHDGILGWAWHCGCPGNSDDHFRDQQCSVVKWYSARRVR
jgi:hypothetical protein